MGIFLVVRCPNCGKLQIFLPIIKDHKRWKKKCVYCGYLFTVNPKSKHSSTIIILATTDIRKAQDFIKKHQQI